MRPKNRKKILYATELNRQERTHSWFNTILPFQRIVYGIFSFAGAEEGDKSGLLEGARVLHAFLKHSTDASKDTGNHDLHISSHMAMEKAMHLPLLDGDNENISTEYYRLLHYSRLMISRILSLCLDLDEKFALIRAEENVQNIMKLEADFISEIMILLEKKAFTEVEIAGCREAILHFDNGAKKISNYQISYDENYAYGKIIKIISDLQIANEELLGLLTEVSGTGNTNKVNQDDTE